MSRWYSPVFRAAGYRTTAGAPETKSTDQAKGIILTEAAVQSKRRKRVEHYRIQNPPKLSTTPLNYAFVEDQNRQRQIYTGRYWVLF